MTRAFSGKEGTGFPSENATPKSFSRRVFFAGASGLVLAGCTDVVGPPPAPKLYVLNPPLPHALPGPKVDWALAVQSPDATAGLDTERIAIARPPAGLDYYADTAWADRLPVLAVVAMVEAFEASARIAAVARTGNGARSDYLLATELRDFAARYDAGEGAPLAVVRLGAHVINSRTRNIEASAVFAKETRAGANAIPAAVAALSEAYGAVLAELVPWVLNRAAPR